LNDNASNTSNKRFELIVSEKDDLALIEAHGPINTVHSVKLRQTIVDLFDKDYKALILNMADVNYMDSAGLATLVEGCQIAEKTGRKFVLVRLESERIQHLLEITRLDELFEQFDSLEEALEKLAN